MSIEVTDLGKGRRKIAATVTADQVNERYDQKVQELAKQVAIKGFRRGHVPPAVIVRRFGKDIDAGLGEVLFAEQYRDAVKANGLHPLSDPDIPPEQLVAGRGRDFSFAVEIEVRPPVEIPPYSELKIDADRVVADDEVDKLFEESRRRFANGKPSEQPSKPGDVLKVNATLKVEGDGDIPLPNWVLRIPAAGENEKTMVYPGVAVPMSELLGLKNGDAKTLTAEIVDNEMEPELNGKAVTMELTVNEVETYEPLAVAELLSRLGLADEAELRQKLRENIEHQQRGEDLEKQAKQVMAQLIERCNFELPEKCLDQFIEAATADKLAHKKPDEAEDAAREEAKKEGTRKAKEFIIGSVLIENEKIQVSEQDFQQYVETVAETYRVPAQQIVAQLQNRDFALRVGRTIAYGNALAAVVRKIKNPDAGGGDTEDVKASLSFA
ncbi:trigger factor [Planctomycetales bacterium]|nr:trigger factor [Planctomycetales bacterium]GHT00283.1 trigger factor [Planctomycetales bacterium]GHT03976.1 trigger factor [Planctomycetales bacterium]